MRYKNVKATVVETASGRGFEIIMKNSSISLLLDENDQLVRCITEYLQKGRATECVQYQQILHRNIVYLGTIADASTEILPETQTSDDTAS
ncbi:SS18-like protein 2 isoform X1 [Carassius gibelio]|uniref:SS18-like protein 2 isoform X1 n=1 Tax=Carassius gibelio TaxID=101364 RepID=UPI00227784BB|nr:SS18-like protein 2 isoform X1 [Carassius gibelio]